MKNPASWYRNIKLMANSSKSDQTIHVPGVDPTDGVAVANATNNKFIHIASDIPPLDTSQLPAYLPVITTNLSKAFERVDHSIVIPKLLKYNPDSNLVRWITDFLTERTQCVRYRGRLSEWVPVGAGRVPQSTRLGPVLFLVLIDDALSSSDLQHW
ncbi:uncharacterized protein LOC115924295 [Strongylocentrotus purpuratus]|uniref:Reverse transcriptase domain-containing protein n=1 Tax=Strongylocentrotus purpuratus TaxID=7668 RepID=A0A7M7NVA4_STRPU|nr:uncharacterized protein LOC115924295 [Strongylocentrotus purpuratus]